MKNQISQEMAQNNFNEQKKASDAISKIEIREFRSELVSDQVPGPFHISDVKHRELLRKNIAMKIMIDMGGEVHWKVLLDNIEARLIEYDLKCK